VTILLLLPCKKEKLKEKLSDEKISMVIKNLEQDKENSLKQIRGKDLPPCLLPWYFPYAPVSPVANLAKQAKAFLA
jgi:hypothetical protein